MSESKKKYLIAASKRKSLFYKSIDETLFFKDIHQPANGIYSVSTVDGSIQNFTHEELESFLPSYDKVKVTSKKNKVDSVEVEASIMPRLELLSAYVHRTPYLTDKYFDFNSVVAQSSDAKSCNNCFNTYSFPKYLLRYDPKCEAGTYSIPDVVTDFLEHLFGGNSEEVEYVINWMAWSLDPKIHHLPYLCLIDTVEGIGKGILAKLIRSLHGDMSNSAIVTDKIIKGQFNSQLNGKTFLCLDEMKIQGEEQHNRLKALVNEFIEIEAKGVDAKEYRNYCKVLINSNDLALKVTKESRRFSALMTTKVAIKDNKGLMEKWGGFDNFLKVIESDETVDEFGLALTYWRNEFLYKEKISHLEIFFSAYTETLIERGLDDWERSMLIDMPRDFICDRISAGHALETFQGKQCIITTLKDFKNSMRKYVPYFKNETKSLPTDVNIEKIFNKNNTIGRPFRKNRGPRSLMLFVLDDYEIDKRPHDLF